SSGHLRPERGTFAQADYQQDSARQGTHRILPPLARIGRVTGDVIGRFGRVSRHWLQVRRPSSKPLKFCNKPLIFRYISNKNGSVRYFCLPVSQPFPTTRLKRMILPIPNYHGGPKKTGELMREVTRTTGDNRFRTLEIVIEFQTVGRRLPR